MGFVFGCIADRINYKALLAPILVTTGILYIPIYLASCMTCAWIVVLMSFNLTILLGSNVVVSIASFILAASIDSSQYNKRYISGHTDGCFPFYWRSG